MCLTNLSFVLSKHPQNFTLVTDPAIIPVPGNKVIEEFIGKINTGTESVSVARMEAPSGWDEPEQTPEFDEITIMVKGRINVQTEHETVTLSENQTILIHKNSTVRYSNPFDETAVYWAVCIPAFSNEIVNRRTDSPDV